MTEDKTECVDECDDDLFPDEEENKSQHIEEKIFKNVKIG